MSKMTEALKKAEQDRDEARQQQDLFQNQEVYQSEKSVPQEEVPVNNNRYGKAGNSWLVWVFFIGVIITVFIAFNYEGSKNTVPLSDIFPDDEAFPVDVEYEFVDSAKEKVEQVAQEASQVVKKDMKELRETILEHSAQTTAKVEQKVEEKVAEVKEGIAQKASTEVQKVQDAVQAAIPVKTQVNAAFTIQVASFKTEDRAQQKAKELQGKNYPAYIISKNLGEKGIWYRVYVGEFATKSEADSFHSTFKNDYNSSFIIAVKK